MVWRLIDISAANTVQRLLNYAARADVQEGIRQGLDDSMHDRVRPITEFFAEFETKHGIVMPYPNT